MNQKKKSLLFIPARFLISAAIIFLLFYLMLPPLNFKSQDFIVFLILSILVFLSVNFLSYMKEFLSGLGSRNMKLERDPYTGQIRFGMEPDPDAAQKPKRSLAKPLKYGFLVIGVLIAFTLVATLIGIPFFNATRYRDLITISDGDFATDVAELNMSQIPVVDKDTASRLGSRKLGDIHSSVTDGTMSDLVSQFEIENYYTQINYKSMPYRVTPLTYADPVKWLFNMKQGLPAYITVNMVTQQTDLVWLPDGMKYSPGEYFFRNIYRHLRFSYPTKIFDTVSFEIDDDGTPYWVAPTITYRIGWWSGEDIDGAVLVNAVTGESKWYAKADAPQWIDQLFNSNLIIRQLDDNGLYQNGFFNSIFGQKNVRRTTYGYNYLAMNDDVYLYTGMSSVTSDQSNIGFVLVNLRTKDTKFYTVPGATEYSAMESAQGQVQHLKYTATFPLLLNVSDRPTYFISLKDDAGLVKMYAFVDVEQYQIVGTGQNIDEARRSYRAALDLEDVETGQPGSSTQKSGTVASSAAVVISGNSIYYFLLEGDSTVYSAPVTLDPRLPFLKPGDTIAFTCDEDDTPATVIEIQEIGTAAGGDEAKTPETEVPTEEAPTTEAPAPESVPEPDAANESDAPAEGRTGTAETSAPAV